MSVQPVVKSSTPLNLDGNIDDLYLSDGTRIYYQNGTYPTSNLNLYVIDNTSIDPNYVWITIVINPYFVDNTYGNGTVPQYKKSDGSNTTHTFSNLVGSDMIQIKLYNTNNALAFDAELDPIHKTYDTVSDYGIPSWGAGESHVYYGNSAYVQYNSSTVFDVNYYFNTPPIMF